MVRQWMTTHGKENAQCITKVGVMASRVNLGARRVSGKIRRTAPRPACLPIMILTMLRRLFWCSPDIARRVGMAALVCFMPVSHASEVALWQAARTPGHFVLIRHALAPGTGDPPQFRIGDCTTQRNLSAAGRVQAQRIGDRLRAQGVRAASVHASQWCRCLDTARLLNLGPVQPNPRLNSFFSDRSQASPQTALLRDWISKQPLTTPLVLVTHQVNITELTGVYPGSGELIIVRRQSDGGLDVVGTIKVE